MMKKLLWALSFVALLTGCQPKDPDAPTPASLDVTGVWELSSVATKASVGSEQVSVYVSFSASASFELYQKIGAGRYTRFTGTYQLDKEAKTLSGSYEGGKAWGPYDVEQDGTTLKLSKGKEVDTYKKVDSIPASVTENSY